MNTFFKILTVWWSFRAFLERKVFIKNIGKNDLVLDVGSGDKPFWRADVIVDKHITDNQQRNSGSVIFDKKKLFIRADVEKLPFKDKVFDFVFCSHLLEHVENPGIAIKELVRVAKKGYMEVPNAILDILKPFPSHLWFCDYRDDVLTFYQRENKKNFYLENTEKFGKTFFTKNIFQYILTKNYKSIFISLYWKDNIKFSVKKVENSYVYNQEKQNTENGIMKLVSFLFYKTFYIIITTAFYKKKNLILDGLLKNNH